MPSEKTFLLFVENPIAVTKQKYTIIGPLSRRQKPPKEEGAWASFEVVIDGEDIVSLTERGSHLTKSPKGKVMNQEGQTLCVLGVPMTVGRPWEEVKTHKTAVQQLLFTIRDTYNRSAVSAA